MSTAFWIFFVFICACAVAQQLWYDRISQVPLSVFGIEDVQKVLRRESEEFRESVWERGTMTRYEYRSLVLQQHKAIMQELHRRGIKID